MTILIKNDKNYKMNIFHYFKVCNVLKTNSVRKELLSFLILKINHNYTLKATFCYNKHKRLKLI